MPKSLESLKKEAQELGIQFPEDIKAAALQELVNDRTPVSNAVSEEKTPEQIKAESDAAQQAFNKSRNTTESPRMYSSDEVRAMMEEVVRKTLQSQNNADTPQKHSTDAKTLRMSRFQNKWIIGLKNMNTDEYDKDREIYAFDVFDPNKRQEVPWITLMFLDAEDDKGLSVPQYTVLQKATRVECEIVEVKKKDTSYIDQTHNNGKIDVLDENGNSTGRQVSAKVQQEKYSYVVRLPDGRTVEVDSSVVNW